MSEVVDIGHSAVDGDNIFEGTVMGFPVTSA